MFAFLEHLNQAGIDYLPFFVEQNLWTFLFLTCLLGGGAAFRAGSALAQGWRKPWLLAIYMLGFTAGIRFLHFALYEADLLSLQYFISHGIVIQAIAWLGHRLTMAKQMAAKYPWAYERSGLLTWRAK